MDEDKGEDLGDLLEETRILLPGAELLAAFLVTLPFTERFDRLSGLERVVYIVAFFLTIAALACFLTPAAYHRVARPIHDKRSFKVFANRFIVFGLVPFTLGLTLVSYLVTSMVVNTPVAIVMSAAVTCLLAVLWWIVPYVRVHDGVKKRH